MRAGPGLCRVLVALAGSAHAPASAGAAECRQALAIGLDVSGSVDAEEYRLQRDGLAAALIHPDVQAAFLQIPSAPVALAIYEWSGTLDQRLILPWTVIDSPAALAEASATLRRAGRRSAARTTAIGTALSWGAALLADRDQCWQATLDLTGDGSSNEGPRPAAVEIGEVTVNALAIGIGSSLRLDQAETELDELVAYFEAEVIRGPGAFVEVASGFSDFEAAMERKLLRELQTMAVGQAPSGPGPAPRRAQ
ncbi:DUF1194 domain-containing protein [Rhodovulum viride]|uniref:DUF1194 domain-containing protein n=1 Tax=Rhodovulum viride TaxID=1231134 RepID=UPI000DD343E9|nr:DUF1194 domain-containing protein [Rhodovulum viride]